MQTEYSYTLATESELNDLVAGREAGMAFQWPPYSTIRPISTFGTTGVLWKKGERPGDPVQPLVLVAREEDFKRLCGRFAQLRSDLSPLTAWCHLLTPQRFDSVESLKRDPDVGGLQAAWTGLIVAEAQLLSEKSLGSIRFPACLATQTFAIARAKALWSDVSQKEISRRFNDASRLFRSESSSQRRESRTTRVRSTFWPIWASLTAVSQGQTATVEGELRPIVASLHALEDARKSNYEAEASEFARPLVDSVPEAETFFELRSLTAEQRLKVFDQLIGMLKAMKTSEPSLRRSALALLAGYLATVAAGGTPTLSLVENTADLWPEITGWAYVLGGIGERVVWTSSFDGLGRLVARELMRPFRLDEAPTCDFALDEAAVLVDPRLADPLVHLRVKQGRIATIAVLPGVNISISVAESHVQEVRAQSPVAAHQAEGSRFGRDLVAIIADAIWPHLRPRVEECVASAQNDEFDSSSHAQRRNKRKSTSQSQLPLKTSKR